MQAIERRIDRLMASLDIPAPDTWKCPFTGELMVEPMMADDSITYEKAEIERWIADNRRSLRSPVTGETMTPRLQKNRAIEACIEAYREEHKIPAPTRSTSAGNMLISRLVHSFRWLTKYKFDTFDVDALAKPFRFTPHNWWPMIHNKDMFINAAWDSCPGWRLFIYFQFRDALQQPIEAIRTNAKIFYLRSMIRDTYTTRTEQLFKALEECVRTNGREREDLPKLDQYKRIVYNDCLEYWGEKPPPAPPPPITYPSSLDYYRQWHG